MILDYTGGFGKSFYKWHVGGSESENQCEDRSKNWSDGVLCRKTEGP